MASRLRAVAWCLLALSASGCQLTEHPLLGRSPLRQAQASPDSVELEIFSARFPLGDKRNNEQLWNEVDEQRLPAEMRRRLMECGFRVGCVGGHPPDALARALSISDKPQELKEEMSATEMENDPTVTLRLLQLQTGHPGVIVASKAYDELPLLSRNEGDVQGKTLLKAECHLDVRATPQPDGQVEIELTPEITHGDARTKFGGAEGALRLEIGRPREVFRDLKMTITLAPGEMLLLTTYPHDSGIGSYFFTEPATEGKLQKMIVIRPSQSRPSGLFSDEKNTGKLDIIAE